MKKNKTGHIKLTASYGDYGKINKNHKSWNARELKKLKTIKSCLFVGIIFFSIIALRYLYIHYGDLLFLNSINSSSVSQTEVDEDVFDEQSLLFVVNSDNPLDDDYSAEMVIFDNIEINEVMLNSLTLMLEKAKNDGVNLTFLNGYISEEEQEILYQNEVDRLLNLGYTNIMANAKAGDNVSKANESEMQTGLCLEVSSSETDFLDSDEYTWLLKNAYDYCFVFRYPSDKTSVTGVSDSENILRYVGSENSAVMKNSNYCLEEYIDYLGL